MIKQIFSRVVDQMRLTDSMTTLEFGVASGNTMLAVLEELDSRGCLPLQAMGFDSFIGLPEEAEGVSGSGDWVKGAFNIIWELEHKPEFANVSSTAEGITFVKSRFNKYASVVRFVEGFYENTLTPELSLDVKPASYIHIDCDMYISSIQALKWVFDNNLVAEDCIFRYDDWVVNGLAEGSFGESKAHYEIISQYGVTFETIEIGPHAALFRYKGRSR